MWLLPNSLDSDKKIIYINNRFCAENTMDVSETAMP